MEIFEEYEEENFDIRIELHPDYDDGIDHVVGDNLNITQERVDGSSVKLNNFGTPDPRTITYWATPCDYDKEHMEEFKRTVELARDFYNGTIEVATVVVKASVNGVTLGESCIGGVVYQDSGDIADTLAYHNLIDDAILDARRSLKEINETLGVA